MTNGQTDFLDELTRDEDEAASATESASTESAASERARDEKGRFAKAEQPEEQEQVQQGVKPEAQPAPASEPPSVEKEATHVPISVVQALRKEMQELKAQLASKPATPAPAHNSPPREVEEAESYDFEEDPANYLRVETQSVRELQFTQFLNTSQMFAEQQHGEEKVAEAFKLFSSFAEQNPQQARAQWTEMVSSRHPYGELMKWSDKYRQHSQVDEAGGLEALIAARVAEELAKRGVGASQGAAPAAAAARPAAPKPATPPSLANGGTGGRDAPEMPNDDQAFNDFFEGARKPRKN